MKTQKWAVEALQLPEFAWEPIQKPEISEPSCIIDVTRRSEVAKPEQKIESVTFLWSTELAWEAGRDFLKNLESEM